MSHVNFWKKSLLAAALAVSSNAIMANDQIPSFMQYDKPEGSSTKAVVEAPVPVTNKKDGTKPVMSGLPELQKTPDPVPAAAREPAVKAVAKEPVVPPANHQPIQSQGLSIEGKAPVPVATPVKTNPNEEIGVIGHAKPISIQDQHHEPVTLLNPDALSKRERLNQLRKSAAESEASLWQARAKQAEAQAAYEKAMKKINEIQTPPKPPVDPKASAAIERLNAMLEKEGFDGIKIISTYGETHGKMYADVTLNGTPITVTKGDKIGTWQVTKIGTTSVKVQKRGEHKELFIHTTQH